VIIRSIALCVPTKCITNDNLLEKISELNCDISHEIVERYCSKVNRLLKIAGAQTRYVRDRQHGEKAIDLILDAARRAVNGSGFSIREIDLVIYAGVSRGFLEPANAALMAKALGIKCDAFDIAEACMGWVRAIQIAQNYFLSRTYSKILIVNAEFNVFENGFPNLLRVMSDKQLAHTFPALTIGEAVTATVVCSSPRMWKFRFRSDPQFAALCTLPLMGYGDFSISDSRIGINGPHQLVSFGKELSKIAMREMVAFVRETYQNLNSIDVWFAHNPSESGLKTMASKLGLDGKVYGGIFRQYGNLVSASIPAAIVVAERNGCLERGHRVVFCPVSAGMTFGLVEGIY